MKELNRKTATKKIFGWQYFKLFVNENLKDYCENTTIHGLKYMANSNLYMLDRIFFTISFIFVAVATTFFVYKNYEKWIYTPIIISLSSNPSWITNDPFPAVTICNMNQAYRDKAEKYSIFSTEYAMIQMICRRKANVTIASSIKDWNNLPHFIADISQPCNEMLVNCKFGGEKYECSEIFRPIITDGGLCCVFNMVHTKFLMKEPPPCDTCKKPNGSEYVDWSPEGGYSPNLPKNSYIPRPAAGTGESLGLSLTLDADVDQHYCSSTNSIGFKIRLHNPLVLPTIRESGIAIAPGYETKIRVDAYKMETEQSLRSLDMAVRKCFFQDEMPLQILRTYTQRNCEFECLADLMLKYCGCVPFYMARIIGNASICSIYEATCPQRVRLQSMAIVNGRGCPLKCLQGCFDIRYQPSFYRTPLAHTGFMSDGVKNISNTYGEKNIARVHIYFKDHWYRSHIQTEYVGITDFLSSVGGIIGLFLGFSFISISEIIYYMLLKPARILIFTKLGAFIMKNQKL